ncbi:hypothetical protein ACQCT3_00800 [Sutcliffiella horikoshii]|uniref:hypothetical protein n=1 Tax=Sutcliffiella horikoshii TaxID=79883 RepID=UPI003CEC7DAF
MGITKDELVSALIEGFGPVLQNFFLPLILWTIIPAVVFTLFFGRKQGWAIGGFLGFVALMTIGPFSS